MADYNFARIEAFWQQYWKQNKTFEVTEDLAKPKFYILDMFPYPSGAGLHVGHPLGYIASDIVARFKKLKGFNVLHPMGFDAFGLPAEQYAIQTGRHPAITTNENIERYKQQLEAIGLAYDWSREIKTSDPDYYKWTQWIFGLLFNAYYDLTDNKAKPISELIGHFEKKGNKGLNAHRREPHTQFTSSEWKKFKDSEKEDILQTYRLAYRAETTVNWCPALGTVLANEEVKDGFSERGGHPVIRKKMMQWSLAITAYAGRLLDGLKTIDWPEPIKDMQTNWIGRSEGAEVDFDIHGHSQKLKVFTTRPDTIFGVTFMVLAPEHELVAQITTPDCLETVNNYIAYTAARSELDRMAEVKTVSGAFTGAYVLNPATQKQIPIYISDYVLMGYGTGAIMAVPSSDTRDFAFAKHFDIEIIQVLDGPKTDITQPDFDPKAGTFVNSDFLNGLDVKSAIAKANDFIEEKGFGKRKINYRLRDAVFSRQRYWGEPFPIAYKNDLPVLIEVNKLPVTLPEVDKYLPTEEGEPPLGRAKNWTTDDNLPYELNTMPGWAGSSWYFFRYMDALNPNQFVSEQKQAYWQMVDLYMGGSEHATGHLMYARFWTKFLYDLGYVSVDEFARKLINQGMIQGRSSIVYRVKGKNVFVSAGLSNQYDTYEMHVDVSMVNERDELDIEAFKKWRPDLLNSEFVFEEGNVFKCGFLVEKMSKSLFNVVNPDDIIAKYGADTLRLYEMFLGPLEQSKPWNTSGIEGVSKFLRRFFKLYQDKNSDINVSDEPATKDELKILHKTIKKIEDDIERLSFNTSVSSFMVCTNELTSLNCNKAEVLLPLIVILSPFAPHISEELWSATGGKGSVFEAKWPAYNPDYLIDDSFEYPVSVNGKLKGKLELPLDMGADKIEAALLASEVGKKIIGSATPKKIIIVPKKIINIVL